MSCHIGNYQNKTWLYLVYWNPLDKMIIKSIQIDFFFFGMVLINHVYLTPCREISQYIKSVRGWRVFCLCVSCFILCFFSSSVFLLSDDIILFHLNFFQVEMISFLNGLIIALYMEVVGVCVLLATCILFICPSVCQSISMAYYKIRNLLCCLTGDTAILHYAIDICGHDFSVCSGTLPLWFVSVIYLTHIDLAVMSTVAPLIKVD